MDLDKLQIRASVRSGWQALDLGYLMGRQWWPTLMLSAMLPSLLLFIPLLVVFFDHPFWAAVICWWLKPFWERLPLYYASRKIFDEDISLQRVMSSARSIYLKDFLPWLLWRRLSMQRAFDMPVTVLEDLKGSARSKRLQTLHGRYSDIAFTNQLITFLFEAIACTGMFIVILILIPEDFDHWIHDSVGDLTLGGQWLYTLCAFVAMNAIMPFHSMAGFALYINRRIELEAWDIEITFRNLALRKQNAARKMAKLVLSSGCVMLIGLALLAPSSSHAQVEHSQKSATELIEKVLEGDDFGADKTVRKWRFKNMVEENRDKIPQWFIDFIEWLELNFDFKDGADEDADKASMTFADWIKVLLIVAFVALLAYLLVHFRAPLQRWRAEGEKKPAPEVMFGLDVTPESIPDDVPTQVMRLWQDGQHREALGLLYRAALSHLIEHHQLSFKASHTEAECAALVRAQGVGPLSDYFTRLTHVWRYLAYGHEIPEQQLLQQLCQQWETEMKHAPG